MEASHQWPFTNQTKRTSFEFKEEGETYPADILKVDARFVNLIKWLGENRINVRLSGKIQRMVMQYTESGKLHLAVALSFPLQTDFTVYDRKTVVHDSSGGNRRG